VCVYIRPACTCVRACTLAFHFKHRSVGAHYSSLRAPAPTGRLALAACAPGVPLARLPSPLRTGLARAESLLRPSLLFRAPRRAGRCQSAGRGEGAHSPRLGRAGPQRAPAAGDEPRTGRGGVLQAWGRGVADAEAGQRAGAGAARRGSRPGSPTGLGLGRGSGLGVVGQKGRRQRY
jgi:hypothetical protein